MDSFGDFTRGLLIRYCTNLHVFASVLHMYECIGDQPFVELCSVVLYFCVLV